MKLIKVKVHPCARKERIEQKKDVYHVYVKVSPKQGMANRALIRILSKRFGNARITRGQKSTSKYVEV